MHFALFVQRVLFRIPTGSYLIEAQDSVPPADRLRAALPLGTNRAP